MTVKKATLVAACLLVAVLGAARLALFLTIPDTDKMPALKNGDIVFQTDLGVQDVAVMFATRSVYSHMGIIKFGTDGKPLVVEAVGPVKETPLPDWIRRGFERRLSVWRIRKLPAQAAQDAFRWAKLQYGKPYDIYFLPGHDAFYCSELVRDAFEDGAGIRLGRYQKVSELAHSAAMDEIIHRRWVSYPLCLGVRNMTEDKCRAIIMRQELITPASIAADPRLERIYTNYPFETW